MKYLIYIILFFIHSEWIVAQTVFQKIFKSPDETQAYSAEQTTDGGYIVVGRAFLVKTDSIGHLVWSKRYFGPDMQCVHQTSDGGYIMTGDIYQGNPNYYDGFVMKTDSSGNVLWSNSFGETNFEFLYDVQQTTDGGYILSGQSADSATNYKLSLVKIDGGGNQLWSKCFRHSQHGKVRQTRDGGYVISGFTYLGCNIRNGTLFKTDSLGNLLWTKDYCDTYIEEFTFTDIQLTTDGGYIISGLAHLPNTIFNSDLLLIKTDSLGTILWQKAFAGDHTGSSGFWGVQQTADGGYVASGVSNEYGTLYGDAILFKTDTSGNILWSKAYGRTSGSQTALSVCQTSDRGYVLAGYIIPPGGTSVDKYSYLIKTDSLGNSGCREADAYPTTWQPTIQDTLVYSIDSVGENFFPLIFNVTTPGIEYDFCSFTNSMPEHLSINPNVSVYPNPTKNSFTISLAEEAFYGSIKIFNVFGEEVYSENLNGKEICIVNDLKAGIYIVEVLNENERWTQILIKQ